MVPKNQTNPKEVLSQILAQPLPPQSLLVCSPDQIRKERIITAVLEHFCTEPYAQATIINAAEINSQRFSELEATLYSRDLFSSTSYVLLRNVDSLPKNYVKELASLMKNIPTGSCLLVTAQALLAKNPIKAFCKKDGYLIDLEVLKDSSFTRWIEKEIKHSGLSKVPRGVITAISTLADNSADTAHAIIEQCALYSADGSISEKELGMLFPSAPVQNEFALIDLLHSGQTDSSAAIELALERLWGNGKNSFAFLSLLTRTYATCLSIRSMLDSGLASGVIRQRLEMKEWTFNKHLPVAKKKSFRRLQHDYKCLLQADSKLKNKSLGDHEVIAEVAHALRC